MRTRRNIADPGESSHGIDLAPMLDFVVNLLIFFIVAAVFVKQSGLTVTRPSGLDNGGTPTETVEILDDGEVRIGTLPVDIRAVRAHVERIRAADPSAGLLVVAEREVPTGTFVAVVDQIRLGGVENITFSTAR